MIIDEMIDFHHLKAYASEHDGRPPGAGSCLAPRSTLFKAVKAFHFQLRSGIGLASWILLNSRLKP